MCRRLSGRKVKVVIIPTPIGQVVGAVGSWVRTSDPVRQRIPKPLALTGRTIATDQIHHQMKQIHHQMKKDGHAAVLGCAQPGGGVAAADVAKALEADPVTQGRHGVDSRQYSVDEKVGKIFCLVAPPSAEAADAVHREARGLVADEFFEVSQH